MNKGFLTREEVAKLLGISTRTVSRKVKQGKITARGQKGKLRFPIDQFQDVQKEDKDISKEYIKALQEQLASEQQKTIKILEQQVKDMMEEHRKNMDILNQQLSNINQRLSVEQFKGMNDKQRKEYIKAQEKLLLPSYTSEEKREKPKKKFLGIF